ncbi:MAG: aminotransferase class IV [Alphaproteobacteria bacterium]|nr:aminotransferase class IV [Alphaproteobacteria bacterium]
MSLIWHNGAWKDEGDPVFTATDRIRYGDGLFDTMLAVDSRLCHADLHYERISRAANLLRIPLKIEQAAWEATLQDLLGQNGFTTGRYALNTILTRGPAERGILPPANPQPQIVIRAAALPESHPPLHAVIVHDIRRNEGSPLSRIKSLHCGDTILARMEADRRGANEALMLNNAGRVACATIGNIFVLTDRKLITPPLEDGAVDGIIRRLVMDRHSAREAPLLPEDVQNAQGLYITNSLRGMLPIAILDGRPLPQASFVDSDIHLS